MGGASSTPAPVLPPDDVILEILLRVPPEPVYLLRVSLVCKKWRRFVHDPDFLRRYRARHRHAAPLVGFFYADGSFVPAGEQPDRVAAGHFSQLRGAGSWRILGSRHGRVLLATTNETEFEEDGEEVRIRVSYQKEQAEEMELLVWDPMTGRRIYFPPPRQLMYPTHSFQSYFRSDRPEVEAPCVRASLICDHDGDGGEDCCHSRPFRVAILFPKHGFLFASVYSSQTGEWGALMPADGQWCVRHHWKCNSVLVGNVIYWPEDRSGCMFGYDLNTKDRSDTMFGYDPDTSRIQGVLGDGQIGIAVVKGSRLILFAPKARSKGIPAWSEYRDLDLDGLLAPPMGSFQSPGKKRPVGFDEEGNTIFLETTDGVVALHLESLKVNKVIDAGMLRPYRNVNYNTMIPYMSFFVPGVALFSTKTDTNPHATLDVNDISGQPDYDSARDGGANEGAADQMM
ncbi:hypothetical protein EJB05_23009, partial [Eragrostis curvula]